MSLAKFGYFLIGVGVGVLGASVIYARELDRAVGEIEEYVPLEDRDNDISNNSTNDETNPESGQDGSRSDISKKVDGSGTKHRGDRDGSSSNTEFQTNQSDILNFYNNPTRHVEGSIDKKSFERDDEGLSRRPRTKHEDRRYSQMYKNNVDAGEYREPIDTSIMPEVTGISEHPDDDEVYEEYPAEVDIYDEFNLERVEKDIEIFMEDNPQDFVTLIFYAGDNTLCDDGEQIVPDVPGTVGFVALERLIDGGPGAENGVIFVHNAKTSINYEVVLDAGKYSETVLGMFESRLNKEADEGGLDR